ncbi:LETM1 domain-containing protein 1 isoform X1 [Tachyglossus aculeatus]|uniref:LETM1 domain-containing protein 1 isoform X1 n=1 Tax=Tachyglossus aculeatus TaxID=9261 RepID=UPI0018F2CE09|nr:LETM1 domain-containing protein 1 isoform X1 [Tachyglossus aculeatus]
MVNEQYHRFLERRFPGFYVLYTTFFKGFRGLVADAQEARRIRLRRLDQGLSRQQLPYRDMEHLRQPRGGREAAPPSCLSPGARAEAGLTAYRPRPVPPRRDEVSLAGHPVHPAVCQLPGVPAHVPVPPAAADPALLDAGPAGGIPGRVPRRPAPGAPAGPQRAGPGRRPRRPPPPAAALRPAAGRRPPQSGPAPRRARLFHRPTPGPPQAPRRPPESLEPRAVPDPVSARPRPETPLEEPHGRAPPPGPRPGQAGAWPADRPRSQVGVLHPRPGLHTPRGSPVSGLAGGVAQALLQPERGGAVPPAAQPSPARHQLPGDEALSGVGPPTGHRRGVRDPPRPPGKTRPHPHRGLARLTSPRQRDARPSGPPGEAGQPGGLPGRSGGSPPPPPNQTALRPFPLRAAAQTTGRPRARSTCFNLTFKYFL